jgi:hypothetical protein
MSVLTAKAKTSIVTIVLVLTGLMLGFHYETVVQGFFPDYVEEPYKKQNQCQPATIKDYMGSYNELK